MDNAKIDTEVLGLIKNNIANTQKALVSTTGFEARVVDNSLRRQKEAGLISFNRDAKRWTCTVTSQPSAPTSDPQVGLPGQGNATASQESKEKNNMETNTTSVDSIDAAIKEAKSGKATTKSKTEGSSKRPRLSDEERKARDEAREADKAKRKTEREAARAAKQSERNAAKKPAHMSKVDKAAARLPKLLPGTAELFAEAQLIPRDQVAALAAHLVHFNRVAATERALNQKVGVGDKVRISGGSDPRFIGKEGIVSKAQRIRCYVEVEGVKRPVYLFTSDVEVLTAAPVKTAAAG